MSNAASQARAFYRDVAKHQVLFTIVDKGGYPAPMTSSGKRAQPFWSTESRAGKIIKNVPAYSGFEVEELTWSQFKSIVASDLVKSGLHVGVNWSGPRATGYDLEPGFVIKWVEFEIELLSKNMNGPIEQKSD